METLKTLQAKLRAAHKYASLAEYGKNELLARQEYARTVNEYARKFRESGTETVEPFGTDLSVGSIVCYVNQHGIAFPNCTVLGFVMTNHQLEVHLDVGSWWVPVELDGLVAQDGFIS